MKNKIIAKYLGEAKKSLLYERFSDRIERANEEEINGIFKDIKNAIKTKSISEDEVMDLLEDYKTAVKTKMTKIANKYGASISFRNFEGGVDFQGVLEIEGVDKPLTVHIPDEYSKRSEYAITGMSGKRFIGKTFEDAMKMLSGRR